jgi:hypothetical protein
MKEKLYLRVSSLSKIMYKAVAARQTVEFRELSIWV